MDRLVTIRSSRYGLDIGLAPDADMEQIYEELHRKFQASARFFGKAGMALSFSGRTLSRGEEEKILSIIREDTDIDILCLIQRENQGEEKYRSIVRQASEEAEKHGGLIYRGTLGKRQVLESESDIVVLGDVEPGAEVRAKGSIVIMGSLYGSAHAGTEGNRETFVAALFLQPGELSVGGIRANRHIIYQQSLSIQGPKIAVADGNRIYLDPLVD